VRKRINFKIATINLHQGFKRWEERRELIVSQLGELNPDILAINEISVLLQSGRWLQRVTKERLKLQYALIQYSKTNEASLYEAQGMLTRFPVIETGNTDYLSRGRIAQVTRIDIEGRQVDVYVTHLHHIREEEGLRQYQVQRLLRWIESRNDVNTRIVCGDFNATPDSPSIKLIPDSYIPVQTSPTAFTGLSAPNESVSEPNTQRLSNCYDYIWISKDLEIQQAGRCFDQPDPDDSTLWPSDHVGVWAELKLL